ncbi:MAG: hypothetical protein AAFZ05_04160, partial [Pseudomonadota bacterium]
MDRAVAAERSHKTSESARTEGAGSAPEEPSDGTPWQITVGRLLADGGVTITKDVPFGDHPRLKCDIYEPEAGAAADDPVVHFIYGGSWDTGEKACYRAIGAALAA